MKIWTVDAFTGTPFAGNPAAVTIVKDFPTDTRCLQIAAEMNLSETAFLKPLAKDHFHIRWFTPEIEVKLCGHATLASSHVLFDENLTTSDTITFSSLSGPLHVKKEGQDIILDFPLQKTGEALPLSHFEKLFSPEFIVNAVTANDDMLVELRDENIVRNLNLDPSVVMSVDHRGLIITAKSKPPFDFVSRVFAPHEGINEDPVTGSAHCKLADYWQQKLNKSEFLAYQASPRGGILGVKIMGDRVHLKGQAVTILEGTLRI